MESRTILVINSKTQTKHSIESSAETLEELKKDLSANKIDYKGLTFFEGLSKTEITNDDALLPRNLPWKGVVTNNLVFMLTQPQKKIRNGVDKPEKILSRSEIYKLIVDNNLQGKVQETLGNHFTRCKTESLLKFVKDNIKQPAKAKSESSAETTPTPNSKEKNPKPTPIDTITEVVLHKSNIEAIANKVVEGILKKLDELEKQKSKPAPVQKIVFTNEDLKELFKGKL